MSSSLKPVVFVLALLGVHLPAPLKAMTTNDSSNTIKEQPKATVEEPTKAILSAWENGDLQRITLGANTETDTQQLLLMAEAFEAEGNLAKAKSIYSRLLDRASLSVSQQHTVILRLALLAGDNAALTSLVKTKPQLAYKIAKVVDIQADNTLALTILKSAPAASVPVNLTLATWLIESGELREAQQTAWLAFNAAQNSHDKQYALALYAEAVRKNQDIERALSTLSTYTDDPFLTPLYFELLLEAGQLEKALALTEQSTLDSIQSRKVALLTLSGNQEALVDYYRQLMIATPHTIDGYFGLAGQLVNRGDIGGAKQVFQRLGENNPNNKPLLLTAARRMLAMNMQDEAIALLTTRISEAQTDPQINFFLFETYLNSGNEEAAKRILVELSNTIAPNSPSRLLIVSGFEKLGDPAKALSQLQHYQNHGGRLSYDQQLHLAELAKAAGQNDVAITQWETLWKQVTLPARKYFLEGLLVRATQQDGSTQRKITQLESGLRSGNLTLHELNLLVAFYLVENNVDKAEKAINDYSQQQALPQKQRLTLLANLFGRSHAYEKLNTVWKALADIDPSNASQYWQQITLNSIRNNAFDISGLQPGESLQAYRLAQVNQLITNLTQSHQSNDPAFIASVYTMAGLPEKAIDQYKKAVKTNASPDALLQLTQLYKKEGQFEQAARLLQIHLVTASNKTDYITAVDGLLNLFDSSAQHSNETQSVALRNHTFSWLQRQLLGRLVFAKDDEIELVLLADIAQTQGEFDTAERIYNLLLAQSPPQRATLLRSMISQYSGANQQSSSSGPTIGDKQKELTYGRRLLALKYDFPPALYASLGRSLLADNDIAGAERAFSLMTNIPGILNVKQLKADAYVSQHLDTTALNYFKEALQVDQSNFDLLRKTAVLEEQFGEGAVANYWYWQGLKRLINQAPHYQAAFSNRRLSDGYRYFPTLSEGLLLTLQYQSDPQHVLSELKDMLEKSLRSLPPQAESDTDINAYPRVSMIQELIHRIALQQGNWSDWRTSLEQIQRQFGHANPITQALIKHDQTLPDSPIDNLQRQAKNEGNFTLVLALAIERANWDAVINLATTLVQRIKSEGEINAITGSNYITLLSAAVNKMPEHPFINRFWPAISKLPQQTLVMFQLQRYLPDTFEALTRKLGAPILTDAQFVSMAIEHINTPPLPGMPYAMFNEAFNNLLFSKMSATEQLRLWQSIEHHYSMTHAPTAIRDDIVKNVFSKPIKPAQQQQVAELLHHYITANKSGPAPCSAMAPKALLLNIAMENQPLVLTQANDVAALSKQCASLPDFLTHFYAGNLQEAYTALRALNKAAANGLSFPIFEDVTRRYFSEQRQIYIDNFFSQSLISSDDAHQFITEIVQVENNRQVQQQYLEALHTRLPNDDVIFNRLVQLLWQTKQTDKLADIVKQWSPAEANSDKQHLLYFLHKINQATQRAKTPKDASGQAVTNADALVAWLNKSLSSSPENGGLPALYSAVFTEYASLFPKDELVIALKERQGGKQVAAPTTVNKPDIVRIVSTFKQDKHKAARLLNTLWRNGIEGGKQFDGSALSREQLTHEFFDSQGNPSATFSGQEDALREIAAFPEGSALFENWLTAMPVEHRGTEQRLYNLVITGWQRQGIIDNNINELLERLTTADFTAHDLQLLVSAMAQSGITAPRQQLDLLREQALALNNASFYLRLGLADVFSQAGLFNEAGEWLLAAVWQLHFPALTLHNRIVQNRFNAPKLLDVVKQLGTWRNNQQTSQLLAKVIQISQPVLVLNPELLPYWQSFVLRAHAELGIKVNRSLLTIAIEESSPVLALSLAKYQRDVEKDTQKSVTTVLKGLNQFVNTAKSGKYNRELNTMLSRLYGPQSPLTEQDILMPWFTSLVDSASASWRQALFEQLSYRTQSEDKLTPFLTYLGKVTPN